jgi:uncharacterized protein (TIGR00369 family)
VTRVDAAARFSATPCNRLLGMVLVQRSAERATVELPLRTELLQEEGVVQGGVLTALADAAAVWLLWPDLAPDRAMTGIDCSMQFLGAGRADGGALVATATPLRVGATIAVAESRIEQDARLVAKGTFTFLLRARERPRKAP